MYAPRLDNDEFRELAPNPDTVVGISKKGEEITFLGWMENAPNYKIQWSSRPYPLDKEKLMRGEWMEAVTMPSAYNEMLLFYQTDNDGKLLSSEPHCKDEYDMFYELIEPKGIVFMKKEETSEFYKLYDGEYILIILDLV